MIKTMETAALRNRYSFNAGATSAATGDGRLAFADLVVRLAACTPGLDAAQIMDGGPFMYGRWVVSLTCEPDLTPNCAILHMDFGPLPTSRCVSVAQALLEDNHDSCMQRRGFSLSPLTGHIVYSEALALETLDVDELLIALERNAQRAISLVTVD